jgi:hypothetical protein
MLEQKSILKTYFLMILVFDFTSSFMLMFALWILKNKITYINDCHIKFNLNAYVEYAASEL